ncbi:amidohydrolase [Pseudalkalibacillus decolorationis]|uniref:amidohydrolase n=1 Tax=Pseudalkalibacillus decolorationis TaxID=163879 RepID=UPI00214936FF|nr:amidohydrolase [Pseudalkalibacillus decolorationis]
MQSLLIKNARLETSFEKQDGVVIKTNTESKDILIKEGIIAAISDSIELQDGVTILEADGQLLMPAFREMHIHIDKTYFSGPWKACKPITNGIFTRIEEEQKLLPKQLAVAEERADRMVQHLLAQGHTHIRTHCNIDPTIGLKNLEVTVNVLERYKNQLTYEIVAFPQHGLLRSQVEGLMREAMRSGATLVGGVDPATVDRNIDKSLETMVDIAVEAGAGIDIHLHDPDSLGAFTFNKLAGLTEQAGLEGRVTISHAIALGDLSGEDLNETIENLKSARIDVASTIPINRPTIPVLTLDQAGIPVSVGHDSLTDHWSPFGTGNTIEKLSILAERFRLIEEQSLNQVWKFASGGITPLNESGEQVWPKVGDKSDMLLVDASCSAEAVARRKSVTHTIHKGKKIETNLDAVRA